MKSTSNIKEFIYNKKDNNEEVLENSQFYTKKKMMKSTSNIKEFKYNDENNNSLLNSIKRENNSQTKKIFIANLNKSDKKPKKNPSQVIN